MYLPPKIKTDTVHPLMEGSHFLTFTKRVAAPIGFEILMMALKKNCICVSPFGH